MQKMCLGTRTSQLRPSPLLSGLICAIYVLALCFGSAATPALAQDSTPTFLIWLAKWNQEQREYADQNHLATPRFYADDVRTLGTALGTLDADDLGKLLIRNDNLSIRLGAGGQALNLIGDVWSNGWKQPTPEERKDFANAGYWAINAGTGYWAKNGESISKIWQTNLRTGQGFVDQLRLHEEFIDRLSFVAPTFEFVSASTSQIGEERLLPNEVERNGYTATAQGLLTADYMLRFGTKTAFNKLSRSAVIGYGARFGFAAALPDALDLLDSRMKRGFGSYWTVDEVTSLTDAVTKGVLSSVVYAGTFGNANAAGASAALLGAAAQEGRKWTLPLFLQAQCCFRAQIIDQYSAYVQLQARHGREAMRFAEFVGRDTAEMFTAEERYQLDSLRAPLRAVQQAEEYRPPSNTSFQFNRSAPALSDPETVKPPPSVRLPAPSSPRPGSTVLSNNGQVSKPQPQVKGVLLPVTDLKTSSSTDKADFDDMFKPEDKPQP